MKILILRFSRIGDCVMASPIVEALRERYPDAHLAWGVQSKAECVVRGLPNLDETLHWNDHETRALSLSRALWRTRRARFDVVLDLNGANKAGYFMLASGAKRRISGSNSSDLTRRSSTEQVEDGARLQTHMRDFFFHRASLLDIAHDAAQRFFPRLPLTNEHRRFAAEFFAENDWNEEHRVVGLNLGASNATKRWPPQRFARLANHLLHDDEKTRIVLFGSHADTPLAKEFEAEMQRLHDNNLHLGWSGLRSSEAIRKTRIQNLVGRVNLLQLASISERCGLFVTGDTGPMHIATAAGAPILALFGSTPTARAYPIRQHGGAPIRVLDGQKLFGAKESSMEKHSVESVLHEIREIG